MKKFYIRGNRNGYTEEQTGDTMTVENLLNMLENAVKCGEVSYDTPIYLCSDNGYTYGSVEESDMYFGENWEDSELLSSLI